MRRNKSRNKNNTHNTLCNRPRTCVFTSTAYFISCISQGGVPRLLYMRLLLLGLIIATAFCMDFPTTV